MGNKLFGVDISGIINANIGPGVNDATLIKVTPGTRTPGNLTGGTNPTETSYSAKGFLDTLDRGFIGRSTGNAAGSTLVEEGDVLVALVGDSIASSQVPKPGDKITIRSTTYRIIRVEVDPADALYQCLGRSE
jgi:hypothetical protein